MAAATPLARLPCCPITGVTDMPPKYTIGVLCELNCISPMASRSKPIRKDVALAIERAWPEGVVDMPIDSDESYFWDVYPKLKRGLSGIKGARLLFEREPDTEPQWSDGKDPDEDPPDFDEGSRSYHLFFVGPAEETFTFEIESEEEDEDGDPQTVHGKSIIGW